MMAAIKHVLAASREQGHCYLTEQQINKGIVDLIEMNLGEQLNDYLGLMKQMGSFVPDCLLKRVLRLPVIIHNTLFL